MDSLAALRLQIEWGADEALGEQSRDHFRPRPAVPVAASAISPAPPPRNRAANVAAADLDGLYAAMSAFDGCLLRATATSTVRWDGNPAAGLVVVGDAPAADDDRSGTAFAGTAGQTLDRILRPAGLDRSSLLLTHLVPWRPPGGRAPSEAEIQACLPFLLRLLQLVRPSKLVLLGSAATKALTGNPESIRRLRGRWISAVLPGIEAPVPALPMLPLEQWLRSPAAKRDIWADLLALRIGPGSPT